MTDTGAAILGQYGAIGVILAALLGAFLWAAKRLLDTVLMAQADFRQYMAESVKALHAQTEAIRSGQKEILTRMDNTEKTIRDLADRSYSAVQHLADERKPRP